ncbi:MAG: adenylate/guanylate cyclase domain-containing protein [Chitinophagaceae bacterium]
MSQSRQLAAIMFTDIVGYTAMMQQDEQKAVAVIKHYNATLEKWVAHYNGQVLNYYGDGSLCIFSSATDAANCSLAVQKELKDDPVVPLRIGLHIGEVFFEDAKALGDGVNVASRVQSLGQENTILVSAEFHDNIKNNSSISAISLGVFDFKNVDKPIEVFALSNQGLFVPQRKKIVGKLKNKNFTKRNILAPVLVILLAAMAFFIYKNFFSGKDQSKFADKSIAVLPFVDMSPGKDQEYLGDGLAEEIITTLSGIKSLKVIGRTSSFQFKGDKVDLRDIGKKLKVGTILEGSVQKSGNMIRITAQLIRVKDNSHLWSQKYDREMADIFKIQDEIATHITGLLKISLSESENQQLNKTSTSPETYTFYLKGLYAYREHKYEQSIDYNMQAIKLDPAYALPYAYIALAKSWIINRNRDFKDTLAFKDAENFAQQSIKLSPQLAEGYSAIALLSWTIERNFAKARDNFEKSIQLNPNSSLIKNRYAYFLTWMGDFDKASGLASEALLSDPVDYNSYVILSMVNQYTGRLTEAKKFINEGIRLFHDNNQFQNLLRYNEFLEGHYTDVIRECNAILNRNEILNEARMAQLGIAYYKTRRMQESNSVLRQLQMLPAESNENGNYYTAVIFAARNQHDSCFYWLEKSIEKPEPAFKLFKIDPAFSSLKKNPAWQKLYKQYGFDKY